MKKSKFNLSGMGLSQNKLLYRMIKEDLVIRVINSDYGNTTDIQLQDESGDNIYEDVSYKMLESLGKRMLFNCFGWMPCLSITIDTFRVKKEVKSALMLNSDLNDKRSVATSDDSSN